MIIKKWNSSSSAWEAVYPKVTTAEIYTSDGGTSIFSGNKIKIDYLPDAVFDSLYFQAAFAMSGNSTTNTNALTNVLQTAMEHALTNRKSASALKGYYFVTTTSAGTINDVESTDTAKQATNGSSTNYYFRWDWNHNDDGQSSTDGSNNNLSLHNSGKGAKFTRGSIWKIIYKKKYMNKHEAMSEEYKLKKNYKLRKKIKLKFFNK